MKSISPVLFNLEKRPFNLTHFNRLLQGFSLPRRSISTSGLRICLLRIFLVGLELPKINFRAYFLFRTKRQSTRSPILKNKNNNKKKCLKTNQNSQYFYKFFKKIKNAKKNWSFTFGLVFAASRPSRINALEFRCTLPRPISQQQIPVSGCFLVLCKSETPAKERKKAQKINNVLGCHDHNSEHNCSSSDLGPAC